MRIFCFHLVVDSHTMITVESLRVFDDINAYIISPDIVDMIQVASKGCWSGDLLHETL